MEAHWRKRARSEKRRRKESMESEGGEGEHVKGGEETVEGRAAQRGGCVEW